MLDNTLRRASSYGTQTALFNMSKPNPNPVSKSKMAAVRTKV